MPQPAISSQPVCLQTRQPAPPQNTQHMSTSADGSVNGKYDGRSRICEVPLEERLEEPMQHRLHVGEADALVDHQALDLVKHRRVRHVMIAAIHASRRDHAPMAACAFSMRADLHRRGVRAQQPPVGEIEGVVHRARRVIGGDVERLEIVEVVFDLGTGRDLETGAGGTAVSMRSRALVTGCRPPRLLAAARAASRRCVPPASFLLDLGLLELGAPRLDAPPADPAFASLMRAPAAGRSAAAACPECLQLLGERALLAEPATRAVIERREVAAARDIAPSVLPARSQIGREPPRSRAALP